MATDFFIMLDHWLITPYRWIAQAQWGFLAGTVIVALQSVLVGRICLFLMNRVQDRLRKKYDDETKRRQDLSMQALAAKNKEAYLAQNTLAQEAYGHSMSLAMGRMGAAHWPAVMALAWMKTRFEDAPFPLPMGDLTVSYAWLFLLVYIGIIRLTGTVEKRFGNRPSCRSSETPELFLPRMSMKPPES